MRTALLAAFVLALCYVPVSAAADFESDDYGFKLGRAEGWTFSEPQAPAGALHAAKLAKVKDATETSLTVYVVARAENVKDSKGARDAAETNWKQSKQISGITGGKGSLLKQDAYWLRATYDAGVQYTIYQRFLVKGDFIYILQSLAPKDEFEDAEPALDKLVATFEFIEPDPEAARLKQIAAMCGSEIKWEQSWQAAAARARAENRLVLVVFEVYRGLDVPVMTPSTLFMHRDVLELVNARFVPMFWKVDTRAPFDDPRVFGLGSSTFGQGIMYATPEGRIVGQCGTFDLQHVYTSCREMLAQHPGAAAKEPSDAAELLRRGDLDAAEALLKDPATPAQWLLLGRLHRLRRDGDAALKALERGEATTERGLVLLNMGEVAKAEKLLAKSDEPEGMFWHCAARANLKGVDAVTDKLKKLALDNPESHWGRWAAALVVDPRLLAIFARLQWPGAAQFQSWSVPAYEAKADAQAAREDAIRFLLEKQTSQGHWINPRSAASETFDIAIAAICGASLLPYVDRPLAGAAVENALNYLLKRELVADPNALFDYTIWAQIFTLDFIARCVQAEIGDSSRNLKACAAIIKDMETHQYPGGGWGYFHSPDAPDNSIGFVTAPAILALQNAQAAGAKVPPRMLSKACESVRVLRNDNAFGGYMSVTRDVQPGREAEAAMRSPLYALALKRAGLIEATEVRRSFEAYLKFHEHCRAERGKCVCHTGPEGTAAYYLLFNYRFAAEALKELPEAQRTKYRNALLEDLQQFRMSDGSYCDFLAVGREYGAGMALTTLHLLE